MIITIYLKNYFNKNMIYQNGNYDFDNLIKKDSECKAFSLHTVTNFC